MRTVPSGAQRRPKNVVARQSAEAAARRRSAGTPRCVYDRKPFRQALGDLGLTPNQVWGLSKTDEIWSTELEAALTATRRDDLKHGTNAAYVNGCACSECREHQRIRMARNR
jgi:hypothetical protein